MSAGNYWNDVAEREGYRTAFERLLVTNTKDVKYATECRNSPFYRWLDSKKGERYGWSPITEKLACNIFERFSISGEKNDLMDDVFWLGEDRKFYRVTLDNHGSAIVLIANKAVVAYLPR